MLCVLISVFELSSEPTVCISVEPLAFESTVEVDDSMVSCDSSIFGRGGSVFSQRGREAIIVGCGVFSAACAGGALGFDAGVAIGRSMGSNCFASFMEMTIFSRSTGVMCFSRPLLVLHAESFLLSSGRAAGMLVAGADDVSASSSSSEIALSRLLESAGIGMLVAAVLGLNEHRVDRACTSGAQQNVSRFHNRQLRFSNRLPSSIACDVFENSDHCSACLVSR